MIRATTPGRPCRPGIRPLLALVLVMFATACEFDEPLIVSAGRAPTITQLEVPDQVTAGGAINVEVKAFGRRGIEEVTVRLLGAFQADSTTVFTPVSTDTVTVNRVFTIPDTVTGLLIRVEAVAVDSTGEVSRVESRDVDVLAPAALLERAADQLLARALLERSTLGPGAAIAARPPAVEAPAPRRTHPGT